MFIEGLLWKLGILNDLTNPKSHIIRNLHPVELFFL